VGFPLGSTVKSRRPDGSIAVLVNIKDSMSKDSSLRNGGGGMQCRVSGTVSVPEGEMSNGISGTYSLDVYRNWELDFGGRDVSVRGHVATDSDLFALMPSCKVDRDYAMKGAAAGLGIHEVVAR
jgi:hypothetical protein